MYRVLLVNKIKAPTRKELVNGERAAGDLFFAQHDLNWAGYVIVEGQGMMSANWTVPKESFGNLLSFVQNHELDGYQVMVFEPGLNKFGGQQEQRVF